MAEWLLEEGIGEERAALVADGAILAARIRPHASGAQAGAICKARLTELPPGRRAARVALDSGEEALVEPPPAGVPEGAELLVEILRPAIPEAGRPKLAKARKAPDGAAPRAAPGLPEQLAATGFPVSRLAAHAPDRLEQAGWSELLEQAATGAVPFAGGALRISPTPAMTLIDVDGALPPAELARAGAAAAGRAIRRLDIAGSIGLDLPTLADKADRKAAAEALDAALPLRFERTAVNGFGFLQLVRRRSRLSLVEIARHTPREAAARALLRRAERTGGGGTLTLTAAPPVVALLETNAPWLAELGRRTGRDAKLAADPALDPWRGHVAAAHPG